MIIRAKFTVTGVMDNGSHKTVHMEPRYDDSIEEDRRFYNATPWGKMEMTIDNPVALEQFKIGQAFYADFTPVDAA